MVVATTSLTDATSPATYSVTAGRSTGSQVLATFTDGDPVGPASDFTPTVNWGGTVIGAPSVSVQPVSGAAAASTWEVVGSAVYAAQGTYPISVKVQDVGGTSSPAAARCSSRRPRPF